MKWVRKTVMVTAALLVTMACTYPGWIGRVVVKVWCRAVITTYYSDRSFNNHYGEQIGYSSRTPYQVQLACACGYSPPVVESHIASLLCRGAGQIRYKGPQGAVLQLSMTAMAHNGAASYAFVSNGCRNGRKSFAVC